MLRSAILHGDKGYDSDAIRRQVEWKERDAERIAVERAFRRWNDFRPIVTTCDAVRINFQPVRCGAQSLVMGPTLVIGGPHYLMVREASHYW